GRATSVVRSKSAQRRGPDVSRARPRARLRRCGEPVGNTGRARAAVEEPRLASLECDARASFEEPACAALPARDHALLTEAFASGANSAGSRGVTTANDNHG